MPCTYSMTVELDVDNFVEALGQSGRRTYLAQIWALASVVNRHSEFKMSLLPGGAPAVWDVIHPSFTIFRAETETFASVWCPFDADFGTFHDSAAALIRKHRDETDMFPQGPPPPNVFDVSSLPWASFTGFNLNIAESWDHLAPIFTLGKFVERVGQTKLPLAVQVHHAAADGFHVSRLVNEVQALMNDPVWVE